MKSEMEKGHTMLLDDYAAILTATIELIRTSQRDKILSAAQFVKNTIEKDGLIYVFGCGHSHILAEETFYRAGGLACVAPIFDEPLMLHQSASESSRLEKKDGYFKSISQADSLTEKDMLICVSSSGINSVPVEFASSIREKGIPVVGISSDNYLSQAPHNTASKHLQEVCDVCIDNAVPHGDACLQPEGLPIKMTPVSTVASTYIINSILAEGTQMALNEGICVPIYLSGNIPGGAEYNQSLIERYRKRIKCL